MNLLKFLNKKGSVAMAAVIALPAMFGAAAISIDVGHAYMEWNQLQASTQAAALAAAKDIGTGGTPLTTAQTYGAASGGRNQLPGVTVTTTAALYCLNAALACTTIQTPATSANTVKVTQTATIPLYFARILGIPSISMTSNALALAAGRAPPPLNVVFIVDATKSMGDTDSSCGMTRIACAIDGFETMLGELWPCLYNATCPSTPTVDQAALAQFPGVSVAPSGGACSSLKTVSYASSPVYEIIPLSDNYRTSDTAASLNASSNLIKCLSSMGAPGGFGTFYADAITAAQADLVASSKSGVQNVIILESDGEGNASSSNMPKAEASNQCKEAVTAAQNAAKAGTWVYAVSYGSSNTAGDCTTDSGNYANPCYVLSQIANVPSGSGGYVNDPTKFYADDSDGCTSAAHPSITALKQMFENIGYSLTLPRLLPYACLTPGSASCSLLLSTS